MTASAATLREMENEPLPSPEAVWTARRSKGSKPVSPRLNEDDFRDIAPPPGILWFGRDKGIFWHPSGVDDFTHSLTLAGYGFDSGRFLDFGCSSGRTVRTFSAAYPEAEWHGCDPIDAAVDWARTAMPHIHFRVSPQDPPTDYPDAYFDGIYALSVWTHFSKDAAQEWLDEMHRILVPGGFLMFTTAGAPRLAVALRKKPEQSRKLMRVWRQLIVDGFVFLPVFKNKNHNNLNPDRWGLTRMTAEWVAHLLPPKWAMLVHDPGRLEGIQDIYVLQKR